MKELADRIRSMSPARVALLALELEAKLRALEGASREPIAVVGLACRFPGAPDAEAFWQLLIEGRDAVVDVPADRWDSDALYDPDPDAAGKVATRWGGFLPAIDRFDAAFFGISPREATTMDPQQRLLLEVGWEALENAGQPPDRLGGSATGVFVGICNSDYHQLIVDRGPETLDAYLATGSAHSCASGRLSYLLGLRGPALSVDTACSSSLVALHLACQSLRAGDAGMALAGGVNVICSPLTTIALSRSRMMASDGRCKAFDASADGFVRSEGCGLVVLKRLSDAVANRDRVLAVIRGSALNQDGRSSGLTAPNGPSQEAVIAEALAAAGLPPALVDYVEAHGTGTSLGDPIEARALGAAYREGRLPARPLAIGSVKSNCGHLESAAGIAGLIKVVLMLQHGVIPPTIHLRTLNPLIPWAELPLAVPSQVTPWPQAERPRVAGVSSFGMSGTNAHVLLEQAPSSAPPPDAPDRPRHVLLVSAQTETALHAAARALEATLAVSAADALPDICYTAATGRAHLPVRAACSAASIAEAREQLSALADFREAPGLLLGRAKAGRNTEIVFMFTGQGGQFAGMARQLYDSEPAFRASLDRTAGLFGPSLDRPLLEVLYPPDGDESPIDETRFAQPALFAVEYALAEMWRSWGVEPSAVVGHSLGEFAAAAVAGILSVEDALALVTARSRLMQALPPGGTMAAIRTAEDRVAPLLAGRRAWIAGVNHAEQVVISGLVDDVRAVVDAMTAEDVKCEWLKVLYASHSPLVQPMLSELGTAAAQVTPLAARIPFVSTVTGEALRADDRLDGAYWTTQLRSAVRFHDAVKTLDRLGYDTFLEMGPAPILSGMGRWTVPAATWLPSLRPGRPDWEQVLETLGALHVRGVSVDWERFDRPYSRRRMALPTYPFERERFWVPSDRPAGTRAARFDALGAQGAGAQPHPLLGTRLDTGVPTYQAEFAPGAAPVLGDHRVGGVAVVPGPVYVEMALAAAGRELGPGRRVIEALQLSDALVLEEGASRLVQAVVLPERGGGAAFQVLSRPAAEPGGAWRRHATAAVRPAAATSPLPQEDIAALRARCPEELSGDEFRRKVGEAGIHVSEMESLDRLWIGEREVLARFSPRPADDARDAYECDPAAVDAAMLAVAALIERLTTGPADQGYFLVGADRVEVFAPPAGAMWSHAVAASSRPDANGLVVDLRLLDDAGRPIAVHTNLRFHRADPAAFAAVRAEGRPAADWIYDLAWQAAPLPADAGGEGKAPGEVVAALETRATELARAHGLKAYESMRPRLDGLASVYAIRAFESLGFSWRPGERLSRGSRRALGVLDRHERLFERLQGMLAEDGRLERRGDDYVVTGRQEELDEEALAAALEREYPQYGPLVALTRRCGARLGPVLLGRQDPLQLLFEGGSFAATEALYKDLPSARAFNQLVAEAVALAAGPRKPRAPRIIEVGAGTGATTAAVLPLLPDGTEYRFTDVSPLFLARARERLGGSLEFALFDAESDPAAQGLPVGEADVVVAANVLHATADLRRTLTNLRALLAPGGSLVLLEGTRPERWVDLTFGLTEGWWKFADRDLRPGHALLPAEAWVRLLGEEGFEAAALQASEGATVHPQAVIVARTGAPVVGRAGLGSSAGWVILGDEGGLGALLARALGGSGADVRLLAGGGLDEGLLRSALASAGAERVEVVDLRGLDLGDPVSGCAGVVRALRTMLAGPVKSRLWLVTRGAQPVQGCSEPLAVEQAALWGLGRVIGLEHPERWGGLIDLDPGAPADAHAAAVLSSIRAEDGEDQVAWRDGRRTVARLVRRANQATRQPVLVSDGSYLVTGGLGGLGLRVARWLAERGARHIVLAGRRGLPPRPEWDAPPAGSGAARRRA
ncbi:MAG: acyltransferase domain-containing protein, partial [Acidobacteria bacterium]|nr:acyltransferase domain-containing protein [Acidobacteriota bacterium]